MNPELSLDPLRHDIARTRAYEAIHTCECGSTCVCPMKWSRLFREHLKGEPVQFTRATDDEMLRRRVVERNNTIGMECPICYEPLELFCTKVVACEHRFHVKCAKRWFRDHANTSCPLCL